MLKLRIMFFDLLLTTLLFGHGVAVEKNHFIADYFKYREIPNVVGFSCNDEKDDLWLSKEFSKQGMQLVLHKLRKRTSISKVAYTNDRKLGVFLDTSCYETQEVTSALIDATAYRMFDPLHYWLVLGDDDKAMLKIIEDGSFGLSTDFVFAAFDDDSNYKLYDAYNSFKERKTKLNVTFLGHWSNRSGIDITLRQDKFARRANMHGITLTAAYFKMAFKPDNIQFEDYIQDRAHSVRDGRSKFGFKILSHLAELYNFSLIPYETEQWKKGDKLGPVARALYENKADFAGTPINMNALRINHLKFVHQDYLFRSCFIFRNPQPKNIKFQEILVPLADDVWFMMIILLAISVTVLFVVLRNENYENNFSSFSNSTLMIVGALCQQGTTTEMLKISTRVAFLFIMIFGLIIYNYYSASVVSARLAEPIYKINDSLPELGKLNLKMASEWMPYLEFFLKYPDWETKLFYQKYWLELPETKWYMKPELGIQLVQKGGFAYHAHPENVYPMIEKLFEQNEICELMEVHLARPSLVTFGVHLNSSIVEVARVGLCKIAETGLRHRQILRYQYRQPVCRKDVLSATSVNIYEFAPHLILLFLGVVSSFVLFILELLSIKYTYLITRQEILRETLCHIIVQKVVAFQKTLTGEMLYE